ncbi:MAG: hypothetical protein ABFC57_09085 [Veillonellales bacterium]
MASVVMVALALYGAWLLVRDVWELFLAPELMPLPSVSFLIGVRNGEQEIEDLIRYLGREIEAAGLACDVVVVDYDSEDLTPLILTRLAEQLPFLQLFRLSGGHRTLADGLPLCRGEVIHVLELGTRLSAEQFRAAVRRLLRQDQREAALLRE